MNDKYSAKERTRARIAAMLLVAGIAAAGGVLAQIQGPPLKPDRAVGGQLPAAPSSARRPTLAKGAIVIPRENCGTFWTGWVKDPKADVNPCPANCERGERLDSREQKTDGGVRYQANYRCSLPELVVNQPPGAKREPGAPPRTNCGTFWTARQGDPNADANPCPANCERGELLDVRRGRSDDKVHYEKNYRCYVAPPRLASDRKSKEGTGATPQGAGQVRPVTGTPQGVQVAGRQTESSQSAETGTTAGGDRFGGLGEKSQNVSTKPLDRPGTTIVAVSNSTPTSLTLRWKSVAGASGYVIHATAKGLNHNVAAPEVKQPAPVPGELTGLVTGLAPGVEHTVWIRVNYSDGKQGVSGEKTVITPAGENPRNFKATSNGPGSVFLGWEAVTNASHYVLEGSNLPRTETTETGFFLNNLPPGRHEWTLTAVYPPGVYNAQTPSRLSFDVAAYPYFGRTGKARYRVIVNGFRVTRASYDNLLQLDGKGDEVYLYVHADERDRATHNRIADRFTKSPVFGDKNGFPGPDRVKAGSVSDSGGLRAGDGYPGPNPAIRSRPVSSIDLPLLVWEGELESGKNYVLIVPTLWEWDGNGSYSSSWLSVRSVYKDPYRGFTLAKSSIASRFLATRLETLMLPYDELGASGEGYDRYIGMNAAKTGIVSGRSDSYDDRALVLTREAIESALANSSPAGGLPAGSIAIRYQDAPQLGSGFGGDYTLYLQVERQ